MNAEPLSDEEIEGMKEYYKECMEPKPDIFALFATLEKRTKELWASRKATSVVEKVLKEVQKERDELQKRYKELQLSFHSCLHPTPYHEREWSKNDGGDWQYETISYLPLRQRLQNDNARLTEENKQLMAEVDELKDNSLQDFKEMKVFKKERDELKQRVRDLVHNKGLIFSLAEERRLELETLKEENAKLLETNKLHKQTLEHAKNPSKF